MPDSKSPAQSYNHNNNITQPGSTSIQMLTREVEVLKRLDHPHIIKLEEILETPQVQ